VTYLCAGTLRRELCAIGANRTPGRFVTTVIFFQMGEGATRIVDRRGSDLL
jgi:hypothetical protein